jgi:hypothetical protein
MAFKLIESAQARWRTLNAPHLVALIRADAKATTCVRGQGLALRVAMRAASPPALDHDQDGQPPARSPMRSVQPMAWYAVQPSSWFRAPRTWTCASSRPEPGSMIRRLCA